MKTFLFCCSVMFLFQAGCSSMDPTEARHMPKADMTEAYPRRPFPVKHHPLPPFFGGMLPGIGPMEEQAGLSHERRKPFGTNKDELLPERRTEVSYGPRHSE